MYRKQLCEASCKQQSMENSPQKRFFNFTLHVFNSNVFGIYRLKIAEREQIENTQSTILRERGREREREKRLGTSQVSPSCFWATLFSGPISWGPLCCSDGPTIIMQITVRCDLPSYALLS